MISERKALEALKPKRETVFIDKVPGKLLQPRNALPGDRSAFVVSFAVSLLFRISLYLTLPPASNETRQGQSARKQNHPYAAKRTAGSCLPMLPRIQVLAIQGA